MVKDNLSKVLVTGANGYIGRNVVDELIKSGYKVKALVKNGTDISSLKDKDCEIVEGDILDKDSLKEAINGSDVVIHLAAIVGSSNPHENHEINYFGAKKVIDICKEEKVKRILFTSSISAVRKNKGPYGKSKRGAEEVVVNSGIAYTIFRPTLVYGKESQGLNRIIKNVKKFPLIIPMVGRGNYLRQPVYVKDVAKIMVKSIDNEFSFNKAYNLAGEEGLKFIELVRKVSKIMGVRKLIIPVPLFCCRSMARIFQISSKPLFTLEHIRSLSEDTTVDIDPLIKDLGYQPTQLDLGLNDAVKEIIGESNS